MSETTKTTANKPETIRKNPALMARKEGLSKTGSSPHDRILQLQRTVGNREVQRLIRSGAIQAKLKIGAPNDKYEQEADLVADKVVNMPEPGKTATNNQSSINSSPGAIARQEEMEEEPLQTKPIAEQITPLVQRQPEEEEPIQPKSIQRQPEEEEEVQTKIQRQVETEEEEVQAKLQRQPEEEDKSIQRQENEEEEPVQAKSSSNQSQTASPTVESGINSLKGGGQALSESTRSYFEPRFGTDFSQVRLHTSSRAAETAQSINAKAFTTGKDIAFGSNQYSPDTPSGNRLLAHELTHVIQQGNSRLGSDGNLQRWEPKDHMKITQERTRKIFYEKFPHSVMDIDKLVDLMSASFYMDFKKPEIEFNVIGIGICIGSVVGMVEKESALKILQYHYSKNFTRALNHGEGGCYIVDDEVVSGAVNTDRQNYYADKAIRLFRGHADEDDVRDSIGDALHVAQDRGAHGEGAKGKGHAREIIDGTNPDDISSNKIGYEKAKKNTDDVLHRVENILGNILSYIKKEVSNTNKIETLRQLLQEDKESQALEFMKRLNANEVQKVMESREFKEIAMDSFNNKEMYLAIIAMRGDLYLSLEWMFDEGTDWEKVRKAIINVQSGKDRVIRDNWMKEQFVDICNNNEMSEAVDLLGGILAQKIDWMIAEGTNYELVRTKIQIAPASEWYVVLKNRTLLIHLLNELGPGDFLKIIELLKEQVPTKEETKEGTEKERFYTVKKGDTLSKIAEKYYGDASKYNIIFKANRDVIKNPNLVYPGQKLKIP